MVERADSDGDGLVTLEDFYNIMTKKTFAWNYLHKIKLRMNLKIYFNFLLYKLNYLFYK